MRGEEGWRSKPAKTLEEAKDEFWESLESGGMIYCPCCYRTAKIYSEQIVSGMARSLIYFYDSFGREFGYLHNVEHPDFGRHFNRFAKLRFWGLVEREEDSEPGWWRITDFGERWIQGQETVPQYVYTYGGEHSDPEGDPVTIQDALGKEFDLQELLNG